MAIGMNSVIPLYSLEVAGMLAVDFSFASPA